jgi:hypothetical protein
MAIPGAARARRAAEELLFTAGVLVVLVLSPVAEVVRIVLGALFRAP